MSPDEIRTLDPDAMIVISDTQDPALLQKTPLYQADLDICVQSTIADDLLGHQNAIVYSRPMIQY